MLLLAIVVFVYTLFTHTKILTFTVPKPLHYLCFLPHFSITACMTRCLIFSALLNHIFFFCKVTKKSEICFFNFLT